MLPFSMTIIVSADDIVLSLCAITITVLPCCLKLSIVDFTICSDAVSKDEVASSNNKTSGFLYKALAMAMRYFCPPESIVPFSPTWVSNPFGSFSTKSVIPNCFDKSKTL